MFRASIIISIYKDIEALDLILHALSLQSVRDIEIIVSEDGEDPVVAAYMASRLSSSVQHLTQPDINFRKNRALNRAILMARTDKLIFIDGDCVPHPRFVEAHLKIVAPGITATGRRVELGHEFSTRLRKHHIELSDFVTTRNYLRAITALLRDTTKNFEYGLPIPLLQRLFESRPIRLLGCNISAHRDDLLKINGFNEEYQSPGIGEDSDIDWRLQMAGVKIKNLKFAAIEYHLYHPRRYNISERNHKLLRESRQAGRYICEHGISQHQLGQI